ncbi:hypothetical protein QFC22_006151 [Naganishia vaughanmartiniae]|uniref:Uncharacterized protein n=1 Tax=Naganishia vaughanmartiniae TaxID=1424756 RepID=A0ACC2WPG4_9TREE|nr:hypothetical protein QFC22_006151 [Naganishia vaughanmartiniae]
MSINASQPPPSSPARSITLCEHGILPPFPLTNAAEWESAIRFLASRVLRDIKALFGHAKCKHCNHWLYPSMTPEAIAMECEKAGKTGKVLDAFRREMIWAVAGGVEEAREREWRLDAMFDI